MQPSPSSIPASSDSSPNDYDVVVIGGAFSGAASAILLKRRLPQARILVVERSDRFKRRVGEATVEISACFLHRVLRLYDYLGREHLPKHGLRYWLTDDPSRPLEEMTEIGPGEVPTLPSFQLDRSKLDEHLLAVARGEGCDVLRPARVKTVDVADFDNALSVEVEGEDAARAVRARWIVDASGRHCFLARRLRLRSRVEEHPVAAAWARWKGAHDLDGCEILGDDPRAGRLPELVPARRLATNHFSGYGWWSWVIPLAGGETSVGVVYDKELFQMPGDGSTRERYQNFVRSQAGLRDLLADAEMDEDDFMSYSHLPYRTSKYMDRGWALVGDAASFLDPYYSPGLDHASISIFATANVIEKDLAGRFADAHDPAAVDAAVEKHNREFLRSYDRWLEALYVGKYEILGDADLTRCAFLVDTALYYVGVVTPVFEDIEALANPVFGLDLPQATIAFKITRAFNQRLRKLARLRRLSGTYGKSNVGLRAYSKAFNLGPAAAIRPLRAGLGIWLRLEWEQLLYSLRPGKRDVSRPIPTPATATS